MSLDALPYEQTDWNKEVRDNDQVLDATDFNANDTLVSTGSAWIGKSVSEMKTWLGVPSKIYKALINTTGTNPPVPSVLKNTFSGDLTWSRSDVGLLILTSSSSEFTDDKTLVYATMRRSSRSTITVVESSSEVDIRLYNDSDVLADGLDFFISIEVYD